MHAGRRWNGRRRTRRRPRPRATSCSSLRRAPRSTSSRASSTAGRSSAASCRSSWVGNRRGADRGQLEQRLLILVTLGLVAFGLVMVFSATSASAALGEGDPMRFLVKQGLYAGARPRAPRGLLAARLPLLRPLAPLAARRRVRRLRRRARRRALDQRRAPLVRLRPGQRPARRAREARGLRLGLRGALAAPGAADARRAAKPVGIVVVLFGGADRDRARPRDDDRARRDGRRDPARLGGPVPAARARGDARARRRRCSRSGWSRTGASALLSFLDPWKDAQGAGFQNVQAIIGMGSGGITGEGLGQGHPEGQLPAGGAHGHDLRRRRRGARADRLGARDRRRSRSFAWAGFRVALECRDPFGKRLAAGITTLVCGQAAVNLAAVLGIAPLTGIPLPFVSYGGSSLLVMLAGVGVLLNIAVNERVVEARVRDRGRGNGRSRPSRARSRGGSARTRSDGDVRRDARPRRVAAGA